MKNFGKGTFILNPFKALQCCRISRYNPKSCCLPHGGPTNPSNPPTGSHCPQSGWYWGNFLGCCLPHHPSPPDPQCPYGYQWDAGHYSCIPTPPPQPQPSHGFGGHHQNKRAQKLRIDNLCPRDMTACPVVSTHGAFSDYECIDTEHDLQSCGGCSSTGAGQDCMAIRGAWNVGCERGFCAGAFTIITSLRGLIETTFL